jgi:hypothetical protein
MVNRVIKINLRKTLDTIDLAFSGQWTPLDRRTGLAPVTRHQVGEENNLGPLAENGTVCGERGKGDPALPGTRTRAPVSLGIGRGKATFVLPPEMFRSRTRERMK